MLSNEQITKMNAKLDELAKRGVCPVSLHIDHANNTFTINGVKHG